MSAFHLPSTLVQFALVVIFSLLLGLEQGKLHKNNSIGSLFGTDRTFTFIGILGFLLYQIDKTLLTFTAGGLALSVFLAIYYYQKISRENRSGLTTILLALIVYAIAPFMATQPLWLSLLVLVLVLMLAELKEQLHEFSQKIAGEEFITLGKFIVLAGVILPVLPDEPIIPSFNITPHKIWLAVVVISGISYLSYLLKHYVLPHSGTVLSGILAGFYSSTAATVVVAKQSKEEGLPTTHYAAGILFATGAMYIRLIIVVFIFNLQLARSLFPYLFIMTLISGGTAWVILRKEQQGDQAKIAPQVAHSNPLELKTAFLFAALFIAFSLLTHYTLQHFGATGINVLSWMVGVTDIDPFLLNLFQGKYAVNEKIIAVATLQAITSNNILKMIYGKWFSAPFTARWVLIGFSVIILASIAEIIWLTSF